MLKDILRDNLMDSARAGRPATYRQLAVQLALEPPHTIRRVADALEHGMLVGELRGLFRVTDEVSVRVHVGTQDGTTAIEL